LSIFRGRVARGFRGGCLENRLSLSLLAAYFRVIHELVDTAN